MTAFKNNTSITNETAWKAISTTPFIEISVDIENGKNEKNLSKVHSSALPGASENSNGSIQEETTPTCNPVNIPNELFKKNERLSDFFGNLTCHS